MHSGLETNVSSDSKGAGKGHLQAYWFSAQIEASARVVSIVHGSLLTHSPIHPSTDSPALQAAGVRAPRGLLDIVTGGKGCIEK